MPITSVNKITPSLLAGSDTPADGQIPAYKESTNDFEWVNNDSALVQTQLSEFVTNTETRGFVNNTQSNLYLSGTQLDVINLDDAGSGIDFYINGELRHVSGNRSIALTGGAGNAHATGEYQIYSDTNDLTLKIKTAPFNYNGSEVSIATVQWNGALSSTKRSLLSDERHQCTFGSKVHLYLHQTFGTKLIGSPNGMVNGYTLGSGVKADKQISIDQAVIRDEDLQFTLNALVGGDGKYSLYFRTETGKWGWSHGNNLPYRIASSGTARICYDDATLTGAEAPSVSYMNVYVLLTNIIEDSSARHLFISSQTTYATLEEAYGASFNDLDSTGITIPEKLVLAKMTFKVSDAITDDGSGHCYLEKVANYLVSTSDLTPAGLGVPSLVEPSVIDNFVSFSNIAGSQKDSGHKASDFQHVSEKNAANGYVGLDASKNLSLQTGGLKDENVTTAVKLGDAQNTSLATTNKTIIGSINEIESELSYFSAGVFGDSPTLTDNDNGTATISGCDVLLYSTSDFTGTLKKYTVAEKTLTFTDGAEEYVVVNYTGGTPVIEKATDITTINSSDIVRLFNVWRVGSVIHSLGFDSVGAGLSNKLQDAATLTTLYERNVDGGLIISESTNPNPRTVVVTSANVYTGAIHQTVSAFNSSTDTMTEAVHGSSAWTYSNKLVYDNLYYDPGTDKTLLGSGNYGVVWFYRSIGDAKQLFYVFGTQAYSTESLALLSQPRTDLPIVLRRHCMLVGRAIVLSGATNGNIESAFNVTFSGYSPMSHNDLTNIQGGQNGQYYHLTSAEHSSVQSLGTISSQASNNVSIAGGTISGITDLAIADGGTGASDASGARSNLGLGTIATQAANNVSITGGAISGVTLTGAASSNVLKNGDTMSGALSFSGTTNSGVRLNNLTTTQRDALVSPANGMVIYNTTDNRLNIYSNNVWTSGFVRLAGDTMTGRLVTTASVVGGAGFNIPAGTAPSVLVDGDIYYDSTQKSFVVVEAGLKHDFVGIVYSKTDDTTITASVTNNESNLLGTGIGTGTIPANFLTVGRTLRYRASGIFTTSANSANLIFRVKLGESILATTATIGPSNNLTNLGWFLEGDFTIRSTGASGSARGNATFKYASSATAFVEAPMIGTTTVQVDTTTANVATPSIQYSQTTAGNSLTCSNFTLELMN